jgi:hypothetical protein
MLQWHLDPLYSVHGKHFSNSRSVSKEEERTDFFV